MATSKTPQRPQFTSKQLSLSEIQRGIARLKKRIAELRDLSPESLAAGDPIKQKIQRSIRDTVAEIFGEGSRESSDYFKPQLYDNPHPVSLGYGEKRLDPIPFYTAGIKKMIVSLEGLVEKLEERAEDLPADASPTPGSAIADSIRRQASTREVFIVHGHDNEAKQTVARFIERFDLEPIILHEKTNQGSITIIEKFERHSDVPFAVVLLTADDVGAQKASTSSR